MAAELNDLFEQGITRCGELTDAVDAAMDAIDAATEQAGETAERIQQEAAEARDHIRDLVGRLDRAGDAIAASRQDAEGVLEGLSARAAALETEVGELLARVKTAIGHLEEQRGRLDASLDAQMTAAEGEFSGLAQETHELEAEATRRLEQAGEAVRGFRTSLGAARAELARRRSAWDAALDDLETRAHEAAASWVTGLQGLLQRQAAAMVEAANVMVDRHNQAMDTIKTEFVDQAPQDLAAALEPVQAALRGLMDGAATRGQALASRADDVEAGIGGHLGMLAELKTVLEAAARLG